MRKHYLIIKEQKDYFEKFYDVFADKRVLKEEFKNDTFIFKVQFLQEEDIDAQKLFEFCLIADIYHTRKDQFILNCDLDKNRGNDREVYFELSTYGYLQMAAEKCAGWVCDPAASPKRMVGNRFDGIVSGLNGVKSIVPAFPVNKATLAVLKQPAHQCWEKICNGQNGTVYNFETMLYRLCWRFLFKGIENNKRLSEIRKAVFLSEQFKGYIWDAPVFAVLLFAMLDYSFRMESAEIYKETIKSKTAASKVQITDRDLIYELQNQQKREYFEAYEEIKDKYDVKTLISGRNGENVHPFLVKELYEAITISEGILQLLDNIIRHADLGESGKGLASICVRSYQKSGRLLRRKYAKYFDDEKNKEKSMYYLEMQIADLSWTNIPEKFQSNNKHFFEEHREELRKRLDQDIYHGTIPPDIQLADFFNPGQEMKEFWKAYFSFPCQAVNHYGLQIFDSIIGAKNGLFLVESDTQRYCNMEEAYEQSEPLSVHGTRYTVLCPMNGISTTDANIYDSMFGYDYSDTGKKEIRSLEDKLALIDEPEKEKYIEGVCQVFTACQWNPQKIISINTQKISRLEEVIKGMLLYIFKYKEMPGKKDDKLLIAFLKCKPYQIIDIVRLLSIYYDKQGDNVKMQGVQIYLRGEKIEEEILFYGDRLQKVRNNIAKSACMRGIMFDNYQTVNKILERGAK